MTVAPAPSEVARLTRAQIQSALKRTGRKRKLEAEAERHLRTGRAGLWRRY
ncbi:hypothetical protein OG937_45125 [Streptomyces sp. NBC_00510]